MMESKKARLLLETEKGTLEVDSRVMDSPQRLKPLTSETSWKILRMLAKKPHYPAEIAKKLGMHEQKVYYHIKQLSNQGLIKVVKSEEIKGALARYYETTDLCFSFVPEEALGRAEKGISSRRKRVPEKEVENFFSPIIKNSVMDAKIVVGSPEPHGKFKARARDNHFAVELAAFFGTICDRINLPLVYLDTMVKPLEEENSNLVVIGGPITNNLCHELNSRMPISFRPSGGHWIVKSELSGKEYSEDAIGIIEKIRHPFFRNRSIILIAGKRNTGTIAAIVALMKRTKEITKPNIFSKKDFCRVVEGVDLDSDGLIDDVEIKE
jgi:DNA-binding transcriptional ArsR family regulator